MLVVGLTGGIASGKSTVAELFAAHGVPVVDADIAAREVVAPGSEGLAAVASAFGTEVLTAAGELDRRALRARVFADDEQRLRLEAILHPLIRRRLLEQLDALTAPYALLVAPLLLETGLDRVTGRVLVVDVPEAVQIERVMARDRVDATQARAVLASQLSREQRLAGATEVIRNDGAREDLQAQVETLHRQYLAAATRA